MITKELMRQAIDSCSCGGVCQHVDAFTDNLNLIQEEIARVLGTVPSALHPLVSAYFLGMHMGYRLQQLELEPTNPKEVN